jgi:hypothetical protein
VFVTAAATRVNLDRRFEVDDGQSTIVIPDNISKLQVMVMYPNKVELFD